MAFQPINSAVIEGAVGNNAALGNIAFNVNHIGMGADDFVILGHDLMVDPEIKIGRIVFDAVVNSKLTISLNALVGSITMKSGDTIKVLEGATLKVEEIVHSNGLNLHLESLVGPCEIVALEGCFSVSSPDLAEACIDLAGAVDIAE